MVTSVIITKEYEAALAVPEGVARSWRRFAASPHGYTVLMAHLASESQASVLAVAGVECIACRDVAILANGNEFTCTCGQSRAWCNFDDVELLGPCSAWMRSHQGTIRRRRVQPLL